MDKAMIEPFQFSGLFVFDVANNHQGSVEHGLGVIRAAAEIAQKHQVRAAVKFQYRQLDSFVHPHHRQHSDNKHINRFLSTALAADDFRCFVDETRRRGLLTMVTPFDEESVEIALDHQVDLLKVASCSAADWPLLETISQANKPVVVSTGGLSLKQIDAIVSMFDHRRVHFAIMHCVSIYPTPCNQLELNQIASLKQRYPEKTIGFSTHESPDDLSPVQIAIAKGAEILERHVGVETDEIKLNPYSSTPQQLDGWIAAALKAQAICGNPHRPPAPGEEIQALESLTRGVYARRALKAGHQLQRGDIYFAMPYIEGQLKSGEWKEGIETQKPLEKDQPVTKNAIIAPERSKKQTLFESIHAAKALLNEARITLPPTFETEFSHHYGLEKFADYGAILITIVNRSYCKKLIIQLPGQRHPPHYHKRKEETFLVLHGVLEMEVERRRRTLHAGDTQLIQQGVWHEFWTDTGVIFEEISSEHINHDSFYEDKTINRMERSERKTNVNQWGRYQI